MIKKILLIGAFLLVGIQSATAAVINSQGTGGACVAVTTGSVVSVVLYLASRPNVVFRADQDMNCMPGPSTGGAPAIEPTTGSIGTGHGFPFDANILYSLGPGRALPLTTSPNLNLDPAAQMDCIARSSNGHVCTWEGQ